MDFLRADDVDYKEQKLKTIFSKAAQLPKGRTGTSQTMFYTSSEGTNVKLDTHQVVMTWRFDLGGGAQSIAEFNQKASNSISLFGDFSSPGLLGNPAIKPGTFSISLRLGGFYPCEDFGLNDGVMGGLSLGCNFTRNGGIEASFDMTRHVSSTVADGHANRSRQDRYPGHTRIYAARLNAIYHIVDPKTTSPAGHPTSRLESVRYGLKAILKTRLMTEFVTQQGHLT